ncbi:hypothetical protein AC629_12290 [Bradyrhizobium sp. NAS80.1]|nr:hypothetical protein AC629_12290 [Bradyrhizobium sp. NAS80.1]
MDWRDNDAGPNDTIGGIANVLAVSCGTHASMLPIEKSTISDADKAIDRFIFASSSSKRDLCQL